MTTGIAGFYAASPGKKVAMAISGALVFGFVIVHMLGNLQIFLGPRALNDYAAFLKSLGSFVWVFRIGLLAAIVVHILSATQVTWQSFKARPKGYRIKRFQFPQENLVERPFYYYETEWP